VKEVLPQHWDVTEAQASALQVRLASSVIAEDRFIEPIRRVAGVDVAYAADSNRAFAAAAILDVSTDKVCEVVTAERAVNFPYSTGLLSFREMPALGAVFEKLIETPDLIICDGHGIAHPRRFGLACHVGLAYDVPTIGCAKSRLIGDAPDPDVHRGHRTLLWADDRIVGAVLRTQEGIKPVYVSPGHRVSLETACLWVIRLSSRYRIPEPIRVAHQAVNRMRRELHDPH
jgi:deoxyribonuclease V